jgi:hypothetical protein
MGGGRLNCRANQKSRLRELMYSSNAPQNEKEAIEQRINNLAWAEEAYKKLQQTKSIGKTR